MHLHMEPNLRLIFSLSLSPSRRNDRPETRGRPSGARNILRRERAEMTATCKFHYPDDDNDNDTEDVVFAWLTRLRLSLFVLASKPQSSSSEPDGQTGTNFARGGLASSRAGGSIKASPIFAPCGRVNIECREVSSLLEPDSILFGSARARDQSHTAYQ